MASDGSPAPAPPPVRLFLGVEVPVAAKRAIAVAIDPLRKTFPNVRWLADENWHITLKFLGATAQQLIPWVQRTTGEEASRQAPSTLSLHGIGAFPTMARARVVWAGVNDPAGTLTLLASGLDAALAAEFRVDMRAFTPHVTVARPEPPMRLSEAIDQATALSTEPFLVDRVILFRSHLGRPAPRYEPLAAFPLGG